MPSIFVDKKLGDMYTGKIKMSITADRFLELTLADIAMFAGETRERDPHGGTRVAAPCTCGVSFTVALSLSAA